MHRGAFHTEEGIALKLKIDPTALSRTTDISGTDKGWKVRVENFCRTHGFLLEHLVANAVRLVNPNASKREHKRDAHLARSAFDNKKNPRVVESLRRLVRYLIDLVSGDSPLPIEKTAIA